MRKLLKYFNGYKLQTFLAPLFKLLEVCFELLVPLIVASIINEGIDGGAGWRYVVNACLILIAFGFAGLVSAVVAQYFAAKAAVGFSKQLRRDLFKKSQSLTYSQIDNIGASGVITRMTSDVNQIQSGVNLFLRLFMRSPFIVFGAMIMAFTVNVTAGGVFAAAIAVLCVIIFGVMLTCIPLYKNVQRNLDSVTASTRETLTGARVIRAFCKEDDEITGFKARNEKLTRSQKFAGAVSAIMNPLTYAVVNAAIIVLFYVGALKVDGGSLERGDVVALYNYMTQILVELVKLANLIITVTKSFASAGRVKEILDLPVLEVSEKDVERGGGAFLRFKNVCINYGNAAVDAISNVNFSVNRGETIGIIGGTGAGKTTLVNAIPHFYDLKSGEILLEGVPVNEYGDGKLREMCGVVPQNAVLFNGTVRENILWGKEDATDGEIMEAIKTAQAGDVIDSKSAGLDEIVEQGGKNFSGGQRQRLTIARALVKKPEILILDDSSSALDYATDAKLRQSLKELEYKPTVFIVSQRTSSLLHADKIIVLEDGKVVGIGTHEQLLKDCPLYAEIHYSQFKKEGA